MSTEPHIEIVANPISGRGRGRRTSQRVAEHLRARGLSVNLHHTSRPGDAGSIACDLSSNTRPPGCIVACGGDGTIQEVAHALAGLKSDSGADCPTLGLAPAGRCNDFARALGISKDPARISETLASGRPRPVDLGRANGHYFCTVATVGVDADVSRFVDSMRMPLSGTPAYLYGALRVLVRYQPHSLILSGEFGTIEGPIFLASSANTPSYGGAIRIAPEADPMDGRLDVCVIEAISRLRALRLVPALLRGLHGDRPEVRVIRTSKLHIDSPESLELWADGERIARTPATLEAVSDAIRVMLPDTPDT